MRKHKFFTGQPIFSQLLQLIPDPLISRLARKHKADRYYKRFKARDHLVTMLYQGYFQCTSLRELTSGLQANASRLLHLGLTHTPRRSTIADAGRHRSAELFADIFHQLYQHLYPYLPDSRRREENLFIIDSTTISLFTAVMKGAGTYGKDGRKKGGVKAHMMVDAQHNLPAFVRLTPSSNHDLSFLKQVVVPANSIVVMDKAYINFGQFKSWNDQNITWITRQKKDSSYQLLQTSAVSTQQQQAGILNDELIMMGRTSNKTVTPQIQARRIVYYDASKEREFVFITNDRQLDALQIAQYYKQRWQIELLFKRIKQRYPLRYFLGETPNAIKIQIWTMLICDLLVHYIKKQVEKTGNRRWSSANLAAMIKHHLMTYIHLIPFLMNPEKALLHYEPPNRQLSLEW